MTSVAELQHPCKCFVAPGEVNDCGDNGCWKKSSFATSVTILRVQ